MQLFMTLCLTRVQTKIALFRVGRRGDFSAAVVGRRDFGGGLPVRRDKAQRRFEHESGGWEWPGNGDVRTVLCDGEIGTAGDASVQQHGDSAEVNVRRSYVRLAVAVAVGAGYGGKIHVCGVTDGSLQTAVTITQEHREAAGTAPAGIHHDNVRFAIAVEIGRRNGNRRRSSTVAYRRL